MFKDYTLQTTWGRALVALVVGVVFGAVIAALLSTINIYSDFDPKAASRVHVTTMSSSFKYATYSWTIGLALIGIPIWLVIHYFGFRTLIVWMLLGFSVTFYVLLSLNTDSFSGSRFGGSNYPDYPLGGYGWTGGRIFLGDTINSYGWWIAIRVSVIGSLQGSLVALTIWRIAYRRPAPC